jgi:hypothetical protein
MDFYGLPTSHLRNDFLQLDYLAKSGPRIVRFSLLNEPNLLAELPDLQVETPSGPYSFYGGHRLWRSPETLIESYEPEVNNLVTSTIPNGVRLEIELKQGISKQISIELAQDKAQVTLTHVITNLNKNVITIAPWALTMFKLEGVAILPQPTEKTDSDGFLHNRNYSLWPYSKITDKRVVWGDDVILIKAKPELPPFKIGYFNSHGWMAYWINGRLFKKSFRVSAGSSYPDGNCNSESYCGNRFIELESLGQIKNLETGESTTLVETWEIFTHLDVPFLSSGVQKTILDLIQ